MTTPLIQRKPLSAILWPLIVLIIVGDQLSKVYFTWRLGQHQHTDFLPFAREYFTLWGTNQQGAISANYALAAGANHSVFKPLAWVWEPWIAWNLTTNTGAAWSLFTGNSFVLSFVSITMAVLLYYLWWARFRRHTAMTWALGAIIGGALGNFFDRFRLREVVDFIDVRIPWIGRLFPALGDPYDFPIFNVADACAVSGTLALAAFLVYADVRGWRRRRRERALRAVFTPYREGLRLDDEAAERLRELAAGQPRRTELGLTVHISAPEHGNRASLGLTVHVSAPNSTRSESD